MSVVWSSSIVSIHILIGGPKPILVTERKLSLLMFVHWEEGMEHDWEEGVERDGRRVMGRR